MPSNTTDPKADSKPGRIIIVMGVSGCGKSTIAKHLATLQGVPYQDADDLHPPQNIALMSAGKPLNDADREPWLKDVSEFARNAVSQGIDCVVACSALKRSYRDILNTAGKVFFVHLVGSRDLIASRMRVREGHFMPTELLDSQFAALESPVDEPNVVSVDISKSPQAIAAAAQKALSVHPHFT